MLTNIIVAMLIGGFMGLLTHVTRNNTIKKPKNLKNEFKPGFLKDMAFGSTAAVAAILLTEPSGMGRIIVTSIAAGYAGEGFIAKLELNNYQHNLKNDNDIEKQLDSDVQSEESKPKRGR
jgi:hypothetical protein